MPMEATGILGALGGVAELSKGAFGGDSGGSAPSGGGGGGGTRRTTPSANPPRAAATPPVVSAPRAPQADARESRQTLWDNIEANAGSADGPWGRS